MSSVATTAAEPITPAATARPAIGGAGLVYGLVAFGWWGLMPLYFKSLPSEIDALEVLAQRITWTAVLVAVALSATGGWARVRRCLTVPSIRNRLLASTVLIAANWYFYIHGVSTGRIAETSLGYFVMPLVNVALGMCLFGERLRRWQVVALALAAAGVSVELAAGGHFPWIAVGLALSFGFYGLARKTAAVDGLTGLAVETLLLAVPSVGVLVWQGARGELALGQGAWHVDVLLVASGVVTAVPLVCFAKAARLLPLTSIGFLQYLSPSLQLLLAVFVYRETCSTERLVCFGLIWAGLLVFSIEGAYRLSRPAEPVSAGGEA
jgi:chloramphenicol-sensitive protein RarD